MTLGGTTPIGFGTGYPELLEHLNTRAVELPANFVHELGQICETSTEPSDTAEAGRDWWPIAMHWALAGALPKRAAVVVSPITTDEVSRVARLCNDHEVPLTVVGGRSGVCGAAIPVFGGVVLSTHRMSSLGEVDSESGIVEVGPGMFGDELESTLGAQHGLTAGHHPQSINISTVGGWVACRGAGQYSTRYGKIDDIVVGLEVVLADGSVIRTGGAPGAADGPDLGSLFLGSEGQLGVITRVWLRTHPLATHSAKAAYSFPDFASGISALRDTIRGGATPAVLRLYDATESKRSHGMDGTRCALIVFDEGSGELVEATLTATAASAMSHGGTSESTELVDHWFEHRNDTTALQALTQKGFVVDTMEVAAPWSRLSAIYESVCSALRAVPHCRAASCHLSHSYTDGACLYFTFAAAPPPDQIESTYVALWDAGQTAALDCGSNLSHHHGVGLNRARFARRALGESFDVLVAMKRALDPKGILNPGKFGIPSRFSGSENGVTPWP